MTENEIGNFLSHVNIALMLSAPKGTRSCKNEPPLS